MKNRCSHQNLAHLCVAIAGGTKGIGAAVATQLASHAFTIVLGYSQDDDCARETACRVCQQGGTPHLVKADLSTEAGVAEFASAACGTGREVLAMINCVAIHPPTNATSAEHLAAMQRHIAVAVCCGEAFGRCLLKQGSGHIITMTSTAARLPIATPQSRFYATAKGAVESYTRALAGKLAPHVLVNAVAPGLIASEDSVPETGARACYPDRAIPLGRKGTAEEVARLIAWLIIENTYVTGQTFVIDGGLTSGLPLPPRSGAVEEPAGQCPWPGVE